MTIEPAVQIRRCAVCRINLKGRFVYVDDGIEKLTGFTREELFGKSFLDFVEEPDRPLVMQMMQHRNHFEANFDITSLHIVTRDQLRVPANVVVSLNFIAGNPVNYQIIIDTNTGEESTQRISAHRFDYSQFVDKLLATDASSYAADALDALYGYLGDEQCLIYQVNGEQVEPIFWKTTAPISGIRVAKEPKDLLQWVAISGEEYCYLDPDNARRAIERGGVAPAELIGKIKLAGDNYLVRLLFDESVDRSEIQSTLASVRRAIRLTERIAPRTAAAGSPGKHDGSVLDDLKTSLASALRIATLLGDTNSKSK